MKNLTKEDLENIRKNPLMQFAIACYGEDLDELINKAEKELEEKEQKISDSKMSTDDIVEKLKNAGFKELKQEPIKKEYEAPKCEIKQFLMSKEQFVKFINNYVELINNLSKLSYMYGISFDVAKCNFNFAATISEIIWDFVRLIFGDDNADDIADFVYGNSNFDSAENLYDELV